METSFLSLTLAPPRLLPPQVTFLLLMYWYARIWRNHLSQFQRQPQIILVCLCLHVMMFVSMIRPPSSLFFREATVTVSTSYLNPRLRCFTLRVRLLQLMKSGTRGWDIQTIKFCNNFQLVSLFTSINVSSPFLKLVKWRRVQNYLSQHPPLLLQDHWRDFTVIYWDLHLFCQSKGLDIM